MSDTHWDRSFDEQEEVGPNEWVDELVDEEQEPLSESPFGKDIISLLNLGELKARIDVRGHDVTLRTLRMDEELEIGLLVQPYQGTLEEGRALATAVVAASVESIDDMPLVAELGPGENLLRKKFDYVRTRMYWPVIKIIYEEGYIPLVERQVAAVEEFTKK